jgi:hypothetical protein
MAKVKVFPHANKPISKGEQGNETEKAEESYQEAMRERRLCEQSQVGA